MQYLQLTISYHYDSAATSLRDEDLSDWLIAELGPLGFDSFEQDAYELKAFIPTKQYDADATRELLDGFPVAGFSYTLTAEELPDINWNEEWEKNYFQPILLGDGACLIRAPFHDPRPEVPLEIIINPQDGLRYGQSRDDLPRRGVDPLARRLGTACPRYGLRYGYPWSHRSQAWRTSPHGDRYRPLAYANVQENATLSGVTIDEMLCGDASLLEGREGYDLILANITRNILLEDMPRYREVMLPGARLILSGFYEEDIPLLRTRGEELGLTFVSSEVRQRWSRVELLLPA